MSIRAIRVRFNNVPDLGVVRKHSQVSILTGTIPTCTIPTVPVQNAIIRDRSIHVNVQLSMTPPVA